MKLANFSVKNSLLINLLSVFIILVGFYSMFQMNREAFPSISYDIVTVTTVYPGATSEDVEKLVTIPIEKEIKGISGIDYITSTSEEGISTIGIYIDSKTKDKNKVVNDIQSAVDRVSNLPEIAEDPSVFELNSKEFPVIEISLTGDVGEAQRRQYAESLEDMLLDIDGTASVRRIGWRDKELWVEVDPDKLREYHISIEEVMDALRARNVSVPGGQLKTEDEEFNVRITGEFATPGEVEGVVIRANDAGNWVKVKDVARVIDAFEDEVTIARVNGMRATAMIVVKKEQADAITLVEDIRKTVSAFKKKLPEGLDVVLTNDFSYYVKRRLRVLTNNGTIGLVFVLLILFIFLDPIPAFMTALGIPIAFFITFFVMSCMGMTINLVTMIGLILVLGMIVDDGIIVSENVYRYIEKGMPPKEAAIKGTNEVITPVTVTILTTFAAFSPLLMMSDLMGRFIRSIPIVVIIALSASLFEAFIILPSHLSDFVKQKVAKGRRDLNYRERWFQGLVNFYTRVLNKALKKRYLVFAALVLSLIIAVTLVATNVVRRVWFSGEGMEEFYIRAEAKTGIPLDKMNELIGPVEDLVASIPSKDLDAYRTYLGSISQEHGFDPNEKRGSHLGQITVFLTPLQHRKRTPKEIMEELRPRLEKIEGFEKLYFYMPKEGPPSGAPVELGIKGDDFDVLREIAEKVKNYLGTLEGVTDIDSSYSLGKKQLKIVVDEEKAKKYYLTIGQIASTVRSAFRGGVATTVKPSKAEKEIDVLVRFPEHIRNNRKEAFTKILIPNKLGNLVPLRSVATIEETEGILFIKHRDGKRVVYVSAEVDDEKATSLSVNKKLQKEFANIPQEYFGYNIHFGGEYEDQMKSLSNIGFSFLFALFLIFIILVAMFRSLIQPFIVLMAIPFGIVGVILSFWIHDIIGRTFFDAGRPLSFFAFFGVVGLTGIVVNDSIVLVDFINRLRKEGKDRMHSLIEAGQIRLRPVIMTSITTIGGLFSVAYGIGGGDPFLKPMALSIVWGLFFATGLTLVGIPCFYAIVDDFSEKILHRQMVKKNGNNIQASG